MGRGRAASAEGFGRRQTSRLSRGKAAVGGGATGTIFVGTCTEHGATTRCAAPRTATSPQPDSPAPRLTNEHSAHPHHDSVRRGNGWTDGLAALLTGRARHGPPSRVQQNGVDHHSINRLVRSRREITSRTAPRVAATARAAGCSIGGGCAPAPRTSTLELPVRAALGGDAALTHFGCMLSFPGSTNQPWHADGPH